MNEIKLYCWNDKNFNDKSGSSLSFCFRGNCNAIVETGRNQLCSIVPVDKVCSVQTVHNKFDTLQR